MKKLQKLSLLKGDDLGKIRGGILPDGAIMVFGADINSEKKCNCSGTGSNTNHANSCVCSDDNCNGAY